MRSNKVLVLIVLLAAGAAAKWMNGGSIGPASDPRPRVHAPSPQSNSSPSARSTQVDDAFDARASNIQVSGRGIVVKVLKDDYNGSRHQRFILKLASGRTLLIAHNIDLAPRLESLRSGDEVAFVGEFEWNDKGGVVHWTHHDPAGRHPAGWLQLEGRRYE